jgi:hypothetical protein
MDTLNMIVTVPSWAYDFCYYYLAVAAVVTVFSLYTIVRLVFLPSIVHKVVPTTEIVINLVIATVVSVLLTMMQFWICRSALKPSKVEKFAVTCGKEEDCTAVAGTQRPDSPCTCGARGFCGGCAMNSNMLSGKASMELAPMSL